jgi:DNA-binding transcriptional LysR family regulator
MEMHQIKYFLAVADTLNFTRAADHCHVTQPALTRAIQKLEEELGGLLFRRERSLTHLTDLGRMIRPHLEEILQETMSVRSTAASFLKLEEAPLNLAVMSTIGPMRFIEFLARFRDAHRGIELAVHQGTLQQIQTMLESGEADVAIVAQPGDFSERVDAIDLYREHFVVGFATGHRFEDMATVPLAALEGESYLSRMNCEYRDHIRAMRESRGIKMRYCFRSEHEDWVQSMAAAGLGFCILPQHTPTVGGLLTRPLVDPEIAREVSLITLAGRRFSPAVAAFIRHARAHAWPGIPARRAA